MKAILNHEIIEWDDIRLSMENRAFRYGDGFFETIALINGIPRFLENHIKRLSEGSKLLKLDLNKLLDLDNIRESIHLIQKANELTGYAKLRISIWRNDGGLYTPANGKAEMLMTIENLITHKISLTQEAGFSTTIKNYPSVFSRFKTLSAIKYVLAGIEKKERQLDDIFLLDYLGHISESLSANIFWKKGNNYFTPPLDTGCIEGIMRGWLITELRSRTCPIEERCADVTEFLNADSIFTANALGIRHVKYIRETSFRMDPLIQEIIETVS